MRFTPKSEAELSALNLIPEGRYSFEVIDAADKVSKSGNEMIELKIRLWDQQGRERVIYDYLLAQMFFKLKHFCDITGLGLKYLDGSLLATDCIGKSGTLDLIIQKDKTGKYPDKNSVKDYLNSDKEVKVKSVEKKEEDPFFNDDLPF